MDGLVGVGGGGVVIGFLVYWNGKWRVFVVVGGGGGVY